MFEQLCNEIIKHINAETLDKWLYDKGNHITLLAPCEDGCIQLVYDGLVVLIHPYHVNVNTVEVGPNGGSLGGSVTLDQETSKKLVKYLLKCEPVGCVLNG